MEIRRPVRGLAIAINQQKAIMAVMADGHEDEDRGRSVLCDTAEPPKLSCSMGLYCLSNFFHGTPKPNEIPNGSVY